MDRGDQVGNYISVAGDDDDDVDAAEAVGRKLVAAVAVVDDSAPAF